MKLQASIRGTKVHEVGYRVFLLNSAIELGIRRFSAQYTFERGSQLLVALVDGDVGQINEFKKLVESSKPESADVSNISFKEYPGYVMSVEDFMHFSMVEQLNKGIPAILRIDHKQDIMLQKQDAMLEKQDGALEKQDSMLQKQDKMLQLQGGMLQKQDKMIEKLEETKTDIVSEICATRDAIVSKLDQNREAITSEIGEQRVCLDDRLKRIEEDISMLKARVGL